MNSSKKKRLLSGILAILIIGALAGTFWGGKYFGQNQEFKRTIPWLSIETIETEYAGLGFTFYKSSRDGSMIINELIGNNTPAARAGLKSGDKILHIDGKPLKEMNTADFVGIISQGKVGSEFTLGVLQDAFAGPKDFALQLERIKPYRVEHSLLKVSLERGDLRMVGEVRLPVFLTEEVPKQLEEALGKLKLENIEALVLDLRGVKGNNVRYPFSNWENSPTYKILSYFLEPQTVLYEWATPWQRVKVMAGRGEQSGGMLFTGKVMILVDEDTDFSAGLIAASLKRYRNSLVVLDVSNEDFSRSSKYRLLYGGYLYEYSLEKNLQVSDSEQNLFLGKIYSPDNKLYYSSMKASVSDSYGAPFLLPEFNEFLRK